MCYLRKQKHKLQRLFCAILMHVKAIFHYKHFKHHDPHNYHNFMQGKSGLTPDFFFTCRYLNSCLADPRGPIDERFQSTLLECTAEDQKEVRKKLQDFLDRMEKANGLLSAFDPKLP